MRERVERLAHTLEVSAAAMRQSLDEGCAIFELALALQRDIDEFVNWYAEQESE